MQALFALFYKKIYSLSTILVRYYAYVWNSERMHHCYWLDRNMIWQNRNVDIKFIEHDAFLWNNVYTSCWVWAVLTVSIRLRGNLRHWPNYYHY